jgi:hypothetical protein
MKRFSVLKNVKKMAGNELSGYIKGGEFLD